MSSFSQNSTERIVGPNASAKAAGSFHQSESYSATNRPRPRRANEDGEEAIEFTQPNAYHQYTATRHQNITSFYISKDFQDPEMYTDMIQRIRTAQPQDIIYIHLNTPGGRLDTGVQIINAISDSQARIIGVLDSKAYSLGTLIFLACDEFIIHDNCLFMIHNFSSGTFGKGNEQQAELHATIKWFGKICRKYYYPFLSYEEIDMMQNGKDFWMDSDEVKKRLKRMVQIREDEMNAKANKPAKVKVKKADGSTVVGDVVEVVEAAGASAPAVEDKPTRSRTRRKNQSMNDGVLPAQEPTEIPATDLDSVAASKK